MVLQSALFVEHPKVNISHVGATFTNCPPLSSETKKAVTAEDESQETEKQASERTGARKTACQVRDMFMEQA